MQAPDDALERSGGADGPAFFWGLAFKVADLDATVAAIGDGALQRPAPAVQPGRRIATLRRSAGLGGAGGADDGVRRLSSALDAVVAGRSAYPSA